MRTFLAVVVLLLSCYVESASAQLNPKVNLMKFADHTTIHLDFPLTSQPYGDTQWRDMSIPPNGNASDSGEWRFPVAYKVGETIRIERVEFVDAAPPLSPVTLVDVRGTGPEGHEYFASAFVVGDRVIAYNLLCDTPLSHLIRFHDEYIIEWQIEYYPWGGSMYIESASQTSNRLYVTVGQPQNGTPLPYKTVYELSCGAADGLLPIDQGLIVDRIWDRLATREVARKPMDGFNYADGCPLEYYGPQASAPEPARDMPFLFANAYGTCESFAELFDACITTQNCIGNYLIISPQASLGENGFVVKKAAAGAGSSGNTRYPFLWQDFTFYYGIGGQNNSSPIPAHRGFSQHLAYEFGLTMYDPSYGVKVQAGSLTANWLSWETGAVFAIAKNNPLGGVMFRLDKAGYQDLVYEYP